MCLGRSCESTLRLHALASYYSPSGTRRSGERPGAVLGVWRIASRPSLRLLRYRYTPLTSVRSCCVRFYLTILYRSTPPDDPTPLDQISQSKMKSISVVCISLLAGFSAMQISFALKHSQHLVNKDATHTTIPSKFLTHNDKRADTPPPDSPPGSPPSWEDEIWTKAHCRGAKLFAAMSASEAQQLNILQWPYIQSKWDGDLHYELEEWGYRDSEELHRNADVFCDFSGPFHELGTAFKAMGIDPKSAEFGGPNKCWHVEHQNGPAVKKRKEDGKMPEVQDQRYHVGGREYRVRCPLIYF